MSLDEKIKSVRAELLSKIPRYRVLARRKTGKQFDGLVEKLRGRRYRVSIFDNLVKVPTPEFVSLLESYSDDSKLAFAISENIIFWTDEKNQERVKKLYVAYNNPEFGVLARLHGSLLADIVDGVLGDCDERVLEFYDLIKSHRPEIAQTIVSKLCEFIKYMRNPIRTPVIKEYIDIMNNLRSDSFKPSVYEEFNDEIRKRWEDDEHYEHIVDPDHEKLKIKRVKDLSRTVRCEKDFLNRQTSETVLPLAVMLCELYYKYQIDTNYMYRLKDKLKQQQPNTLNNLSVAYSIAKNNLNEFFGMEEFHYNLKSALEEGFVDKWARAIVDGYRTRRDEDGLKKVLQDVA